MKNHKQATTKRPFRKGKRFVFGSSRSGGAGENTSDLIFKFRKKSIINSKFHYLLIKSKIYY